MRKLKKRHTGGCIDKRLSPETLEQIGPDIELRELIADLVGHYRFMLKVRETAPQKATVEHYLTELCRRSQELRGIA